MKTQLTLILSMFWLTVMYSQISNSIPFIWSNDLLSGVPFEKTAMHIPIQFEHDTTTYYFQFDTGSNKSYLYTGTKSDTNIIKSISTGTDLATSIGEIRLLPRTSNNTYKKNGTIHIGTIGADFLSDKVIEIDFINQRINVLSTYNDTDFYIENMILSRGRPTITLKAQDKEYSFLFDTGSSLFDLWTTEKKWKKWKNKESDISKFPISSWGKTYTSYRALYTTSATEVNTPFAKNLKYIWYSSNNKFKKIFRQAKVSGIIGNRSFLDQTVLLDFKAGKRGIKKVSSDN